MQQTALRFQKEDHCIVKLVSDIKRSVSTSWRVVTPQLMGRSEGARILRNKLAGLKRGEHVRVSGHSPVPRLVGGVGFALTLAVWWWVIQQQFGPVL